jgi:hypothetical protein
MTRILWVMLMKSLNGWSDVLMSAWRKQYLLVCVGNINKVQFIGSLSLWLSVLAGT